MRLEQDKGDIASLVEELIQECDEFTSLATEEVTINCMLAIAEERDLLGALHLHGYRCYAIIGITPYEQRVKGLADAHLKVDSQAWENMEPRTREAMLHHELMHLEVQKDREGGTKYDKIGRPKLRMRLHDINFGWFKRTAERYGMRSIELNQAYQLFRGNRQLLFPFAQEREWETPGEIHVPANSAETAEV